MAQDWLPTTMTGRLDMAKRWQTVIGPGGQATPPWGIPDETAENLSDKIDKAEAALNEATQEERTPSLNQRIRTAFGELVAAMRDLRRRHFFIPPLTESDWIGLGMRLPDTTQTNIGPPTSRVTAVMSRPGQATLGLHIVPADSNTYDERAEWGFRVYWGILPHGGASETEHFERQHLLRVPQRPEELPQSHFTRRKRDQIEFEFDESGMTAYICIRYENSKGDKGPWGPMVNSVIP